MPKYIVRSDGPIEVREVTRPTDPDAEVGGGPIIPDRPTLPPDWERPTLPPREEWPPLPPFLQPGVGLPIPPSPEFPMVPVDPPIDPPPIWPPVMPELPDLSGKTLVLACFFVSRHVKKYRWVVIDHAEVKAKVEAAKQWLKDNMPAGGIVGRPPSTGNRPG